MGSWIELNWTVETEVVVVHCKSLYCWLHFLFSSRHGGVHSGNFGAIELINFVGAVDDAGTGRTGIQDHSYYVQHIGTNADKAFPVNQKTPYYFKTKGENVTAK